MRESQLSTGKAAIEDDAPAPASLEEDDPTGDEDPAGEPDADEENQPDAGEDPTGDDDEDEEGGPDAGSDPLEDASTAPSGSWQPPKGETWKPRFDGRDLDLPGAITLADGSVYLPKEALNRLQPFLADRNQFNRTINEWRQKYDERDPEKQRVVRESNALVDELTKLLKGPEEAFLTWADSYRQNADTLLLQAKNRALEEQVQQGTTRQSEAQQQERMGEIDREVQQASDGIVSTFLKNERYAALGLDAKRMRTLIDQNAERIFFEADRDMPEAGLRTGDIGVWPDVIEQVFENEAWHYRRQAEQKAAGGQNRAMTKPSIPVPTGRSTSPAPSAKKKYRDKAHYDAEMAQKYGGRGGVPNT